jgi:thioredoxin reductase
LRDVGVEFIEEKAAGPERASGKRKEMKPVCDPQSLESNVPGVYLAGVIVAGTRTSEIFIENGRFHGAQIAADLRKKLTPSGTPLPAHTESAFIPASGKLQSAE